MSEIKPVYQTRFIATGFPEAWVNTDIQLFNHRKSQPERFETRILYPAAAYEALQKENDQWKTVLDCNEQIRLRQANRIEELEDRLSSLPIPNTVAIQKISKLRSEGFKEYAATVLNKENQYCIVGDYGDVRWLSKNGE